MLSAIRNFLTAPVYEGDPEKTQDAFTTHWISVALLGISIPSIPLAFLIAQPMRGAVITGTSIGFVLWLFTIYLVKREKRTLSKIIILTVSTLNIYGYILFTGGIAQPAIIILLFLLAMANLLFPIRGAVFYSLVLLVLIALLYILDLTGFAPVVPEGIAGRSLIISFLFTLLSVATVLWVSSTIYRRNLDAIRKNENEVRERNVELNQLRDSLEQRVAERTIQLEKRASQFAAISNVARSIASVRDMGSLLPAIARLVIESFGFYHTGIFLLDQRNEFAVLAASPTEAGKKMIANGHKLRVGEVGIVGRVASTGEPRITLDTGLDAIHFNNPLLPNTRSEMALPLKAGDIIIGVLDIQSDQPQAFTEDDVAVMQTLADQIAIAIERTRLVQQLEGSLKDLETMYGRTTSESWKSLAQSGLLDNFGYQFDNVRIQPISTITSLGAEALRTGEVLTEDNQNNKGLTAIPIKLRGQSIGVVTVKFKEGYSKNTIETIQQAVERLAGSLESARLFEEARLRADREQAIAQVTSSISSANELDTILRTTVEQIGKTLGQTEVSIQIINDTEEQTS